MGARAKTAFSVSFGAMIGAIAMHFGFGFDGGRTWYGFAHFSLCAFLCAYIMPDRRA